MALWHIALGTIAVVIIIAIIMAALKKDPEKYIKKAEKAHKLAEKYHNENDEELAKDYYEEAEFYRKKAMV